MSTSEIITERVPLQVRLDRRTVVLATGCREWGGYRDRRGYGRIDRPDWIPGEGPMSTHRAAWWLAFGPIPHGMFVCHHCDNPPCVNPAHLFLGTNQDNVDDRNRKGRQAHHLLMKGELNGRAVLTEVDVQRIRSGEFAGLTQAQVGAMFGVSRVAISDIRNHRKWKHVTTNGESS